MATALRPAGSDANEVEVRWEDQQKINKFGALTNARDELKDQIAYCKVKTLALVSTAFTLALPSTVSRRLRRLSRMHWMQLKKEK